MYVYNFLLFLLPFFSKVLAVDLHNRLLNAAIAPLMTWLQASLPSMVCSSLAPNLGRELVNLQEQMNLLASSLPMDPSIPSDDSKVPFPNGTVWYRSDPYEPSDDTPPLLDWTQKAFTQEGLSLAMDKVNCALGKESGKNGELVFPLVSDEGSSEGGDIWVSAACACPISPLMHHTSLVGITFLRFIISIYTLYVHLHLHMKKDIPKPFFILPSFLSTPSFASGCPPSTAHYVADRALTR